MSVKSRDLHNLKQAALAELNKIREVGWGDEPVEEIQPGLKNNGKKSPIARTIGHRVRHGVSFLHVGSKKRVQRLAAALNGVSAFSGDSIFMPGVLKDFNRAFHDNQFPELIEE